MVSALVVVLSILVEHGFLPSNMVPPDGNVVTDVCYDAGGSPSWLEQHLSLGLGLSVALASTESRSTM